MAQFDNDVGLPWIGCHSYHALVVMVTIDGLSWLPLLPRLFTCCVTYVSLRRRNLIIYAIYTEARALPINYINLFLQL